MAVKAVYVQKGETIDLKAAKAVEYMEVVPLGACLGVALEPIAAGETGAVTIAGVYELPAATGTAIAVGDAVFWNKADSQIDKTATGIPAGIAVTEKTAAGTAVQVKLGFVAGK